MRVTRLIPLPYSSHLDGRHSRQGMCVQSRVRRVESTYVENVCGECVWRMCVENRVTLDSPHTFYVCGECGRQVDDTHTHTHNALDSPHTFYVCGECGRQVDDTHTQRTLRMWRMESRVHVCGEYCGESSALCVCVCVCHPLASPSHFDDGRHTRQRTWRVYVEGRVRCACLRACVFHPLASLTH